MVVLVDRGGGGEDDAEEADGGEAAAKVGAADRWETECGEVAFDSWAREEEEEAAESVDAVEVEGVTDRAEDETGRWGVDEEAVTTGGRAGTTASVCSAEVEWARVGSGGLDT